jgi:pyrimidine operon attenuation protein/uracil phosphoribosyltransferase
MSASEIERTLVRLAHEIVERNDGSANLGLVGIKRRGVPLAQRIAKDDRNHREVPVDTGVLDISFYRDDLSTAGPARSSKKATSASTSTAATSS